MTTAPQGYAALSLPKQIYNVLQCTRLYVLYVIQYKIFIVLYKIFFCLFFKYVCILIVILSLFECLWN
jgi:hypothetical protein